MTTLSIEQFGDDDVKTPYRWGNRNLGTPKEVYNLFVSAIVFRCHGHAMSSINFSSIDDVKVKDVKIKKIELKKRAVTGAVDNKKIFQFKKYFGGLKIKVKIDAKKKKIKIVCDKIPDEIPTMLGMQKVSHKIKSGLKKQLAEAAETK